VRVQARRGISSTSGSADGGDYGERSAQRLLRQKYGRHDEFYGRIDHPPHSIH
jgi:hypothetical protein